MRTKKWTVKSKIWGRNATARPPLTGPARRGPRRRGPRLQVSPASISKAVGYLEAQELVRRERDPRSRAERYVIDDDVWYQAMVASARANALLADTARQSARTLGPATPAGVRLENMGQFLTRVGEDLVRSAEHWREVYAAPRTGEHG
ncbi:hypothetical protein AB0G15_41770 [Streptosporangium sp. NPDC023825]|uniref:hypothetical protein n=1 Tax=Streptosporangium sp. NPDC023825 TaxID=3154909 RepID=UPI00342C00B6